MFSSSKKTTKEDPQSLILDNIEKGTPKLPSLIMTPIFSNNSTWPSYLIKPVYNENEINTPVDNHYYDAVNNLASNITSYGHTTHVTQNRTQMFPVMPYYLQGTKTGGETVHPTMYQYQGWTYNNQNINYPNVPTTSHMVTNDEQRKQKLWYYQKYQPNVYDNVV